jgi:flagellar biosynthesis/type III secretory pathway chaperone
MLHGTELHPETVLSAPATQQWKTEITGKRNTSLMSRLAELGNVLAGIEKVSNSHIDKETDSSISIENASVNMYVDQIANDYDARRAGNQALEKILEVARKSNGNNRIGR